MSLSFFSVSFALPPATPSAPVVAAILARNGTRYHQIQTNANTAVVEVYNLTACDRIRRRLRAMGYRTPVTVRRAP